MFKDINQLKTFTKLTKPQEKIIEKYLPGPYTFIVKASSKIPEHLVADNETIGVRIPQNRLCQSLVKELGHPIITTSFNISGQKNLNDPQNFPKQMKEIVDVILDAGKLTSQHSTIIDLTQNPHKVIRQGQGVW